MKNTILLLLFLAVSYPLAAQMQKGSVLLGGTAGVNNLNEDGEGITFINMNPKVGFFLSDRFALGGGVDLNLAASDGETEGNFGANAFVRFYFNNTSMARFFALAEVGTREPDLDDDETDFVTMFGTGVGVDLFLNRYVALEFLAGYRRYQHFESDTGVNQIGLNVGVVAFIGGEEGD